MEHVEIKKACLDGAEIQFQSGGHLWFSIRDNNELLGGQFDNDRLRINPFCDYVFDTIFKLGGKTLLKTYKDWIYGKNSFNVVLYNDEVVKSFHRTEYLDDPFMAFITVESNEKWFFKPIEKEPESPIWEISEMPTEELSITHESSLIAVVTHECVKPREEVMYNAKLIAAAPEMLRLLQDMDEDNFQLVDIQRKQIIEKITGEKQ